jgi:probable addiction module antidote protein
MEWYVSRKEWAMKKETFSAFDAADYLKSEEDIAAYLDAATEDGDPQVLVAAMGDIVRARNVTRVARDAGLTREGVYKALSPEGNPSFATVWTVARALDIQFSFRSTENRLTGRGKPVVKVGAKAGGAKRRTDTGRINIDDPASVRYWSKALGVSSSKLKSAVKQSNTNAAVRDTSARVASTGRRTGR